MLSVAELTTSRLLCACFFAMSDENELKIKSVMVDDTNEINEQTC